MAKKKKNPNKVNYEKVCREYAERCELERLNQRTREHLDEIQKKMWEQQAKEAYLRVKHERRTAAAVKVIFLVILSLVLIATSLVLANEGAFPWWVGIVIAAFFTVASAFTAGYFWHELKN